MSILKRDAKLKSLSIAAGLLASCCLTVRSTLSRSYSRSLVATRRGFTFYLADPLRFIH